MRIEPYLFFDGNCETALGFYAECLGGHITALHRYEGSPMEEQLPADWKSKVMHATLEAGGHRFMASDRMPGQPFAGHAGFSMSVNLPGDATRGEAVFKALATGGMITMPFAQTFWGAHFGMLVDKFGVGWMVNCESQPQA
ncbi:MAG: VOC family protein [Ramlibacter sp.]